MAEAQESARLLLETMPALMRGLHTMRRGQFDEDAASVGQLRMLEMLRARSWSLSELATRHHVTPSTMSRSIDVLVRRDWVTRQSDPNDRRQLVLQLSDEGRAAHDTLRAALSTMLADRIAELEPDEQVRLYEGLLVLQKLANSQPNTSCAPESAEE